MPIASKNSISRNQKLVLKILQNSKKNAIGAYDILDMLRPNGFKAPLQVYRALNQLIRKGLVHRLESLNAFVACSYPECEKYNLSAFMICRWCGTVIEIEDRRFINTIKNIKMLHFVSEEIIMEIRGHCIECHSLV